MTHLNTILLQKYECALEALAMKHARRCRYEHSARETRPNIGENIFQVDIPNFDKKRAAQMVCLLAQRLYFKLFPEYMRSYVAKLFLRVRDTIYNCYPFRSGIIS